jgi:hypothetical protein
VIVADSFITMNVVPPITGEFFLIENCAIGAQKFGSLITFTSIMAYVIALASSFNVGIHSGNGWYAIERKKKVVSKHKSDLK